MRKSCLTASIWTLLCVTAFSQKYNFNLGVGPGFPLGKASNFANTSYNLEVGGGPNLSAHVKLNAEFMFHGLPVSDRFANQLGVSNVKGRLYSLAGNVMVGSSSVGNDKAVYLIAGGGWYRRTLEAQQTVLKAGEVCVPAWVWWNVECVNGIFPTDETIASRTASAGGFNVGGGFAFRLGDSSAHFYTEVRYHHAFTRGIETVVLPLTFGIRW